jgi:deoxyadenosine/deoxycytidine kinase
MDISAYIVINGPFGVGKSTIVKNLVLKNNWRYLHETTDSTVLPKFIGPEGNPFLCEMWFLMNSLMRERSGVLKEGGIKVADGGGAHIIVYAKAYKKLGKMSEEEFQVLNNIHNLLSFTPPDLEIVLHASANETRKRIEMRDRVTKSEWGEDNTRYIKVLNSEFVAYGKYFSNLRNIKMVDTTNKTEKQTTKEVEALIHNFLNVHVENLKKFL